MFIYKYIYFIIQVTHIPSHLTMVDYIIFHYGEACKGIFSIHAFPFPAQCLNI